jgi:predicted MFS family arabinose efflux permease
MHERQVPGSGVSRVLVGVFAGACGLVVANIYYSQPLIGLIAPAVGLQPGLAGLIVALTQLLVVGVFAVATQILVPFASHLTPEASRGKVVGTVMSGLLGGIMLARPFSSYIAATLGWRAVFYISAGMMLALLLVLRRVLPQRHPNSALTYSQILRTLPALIADTPLLRRRALYQGMLFAGFNLFWTGSPLLLAKEFGMGQRGIALFALAGAAGALSAPVAGRLADRGLTPPTTGWSLVAVVLAFGLAIEARLIHSLSLLILAALILNAAVQVCQVLSLRNFYMLAPELRGRLNGLFVAFAFLCGAAGSGLAAAVYTSRGWTTLAALGAVCAGVALAQFGAEYLRVNRRVLFPTY